MRMLARILRFDIDCSRPGHWQVAELGDDDADDCVIFIQLLEYAIPPRPRPCHKNTDPLLF